MAKYSHLNNDWKNICCSSVDLSVRTSNCLSKMNVTTLGELANLSDAELLSQPNFGKKSLMEVRSLLSSIEKLITRKEFKHRVDKFDFLSASEPLAATVLQPIDSLELTTRAQNVMANLGITTVGELAQLTEIGLRYTPNVGRLTINNFKNALDQFGLSLGTTIQNWPSKDELQSLLEAREEKRLNQNQTHINTHTFLEEELCAAVNAAVSPDESAIVMRRTGWDGESIWTLEELADDPTVSRRASRVTRERIRQIESKAIKKVQKKGIPTPILHNAVSLIEENAPLTTASLSRLLCRHDITRRTFGYKAFLMALKTFQINWDLRCIVIGQDTYLVPSGQSGEIKYTWNTLVRAATNQDFVKLDEIVNSGQHKISLESANSCISKVSSLDWLDQDRRIYWNLDRVSHGRNKTVNMCCKLFSVVPEMPLKRLFAAVKRASKVKHFLSDDTFINMLLALEEFEISNGIVSRGARFVARTLNDRDRVMINIAIDVGAVLTFNELREVLVRRGFSTNCAQVLITTSPFWVRTAPRKYRFIGKQARLKTVVVDKLKGHEEGLVDLEVSHRHLITGNHRITEGIVQPGQWLLRDVQGNNLGKINITENMIKGLNRSLLIAGIEAGTHLIIDFSKYDFEAIVYW